MSAHPTSRNRSQRQKVKARYLAAREDAQLYGLIPTTPEGAVRDERVDPTTQGEQALPALDRTSIRRGRAVPDEKKPQVDRRPAIVPEPGSAAHEVIARARALLAGDQRPWERNNADLANNVKMSGARSTRQSTLSRRWRLC